MWIIPVVATLATRRTGRIAGLPDHLAGESHSGGVTSACLTEQAIAARRRAGTLRKSCPSSDVARHRRAMTSNLARPSPLVAAGLGAVSAFAFQPTGWWPLMPLAFAALCELLL